jgi:hypothetical protein
MHKARAAAGKMSRGSARAAAPVRAQFAGGVAKVAR